MLLFIVVYGFNLVFELKKVNLVKLIFAHGQTIKVDSKIWRIQIPLSGGCYFYTQSDNLVVLRSAMFISRQQFCVGDMPKLALLFLQLCPEKHWAIHMMAVVFRIKPRLPSFTIFSQNSKAWGWAAWKHETRRGLVITCCAWWVSHVEWGAGNNFIVLVIAESCTEWR